MNTENNIDLRSMFDAYMFPNYSPSKYVPHRGQASKVWDKEGKEFVDFAGGIAVNCLGHCHPQVNKALIKAIDSFWHTSNILTNSSAVLLAKKFVDSTFADKVFFANSGAEANEAAFKLARRYYYDQGNPDKNHIISFHNGFHGRTFFTVSVGGKSSYSEGFGPNPTGIIHSQYNNIQAVTDVFSENVCAVVVEPILGEGGIVPADPDFLIALRRLCDQYDAALIFDEVQTGVGRTGKLYAYMHHDIEPDILTTSKSLGNGFPVAALLAKSNFASSFKVGTHGSTFGGNNLACTVALEVLNIVDDKDLLLKVSEKEAIFREHLLSLNNEYNIFSDIRGKGMMLGCLLNDSYKGMAKQIITSAMDCGLIMLIAGADVVRLTPSLIIEDDVIAEGFVRFRRAIEGFLNQLKGVD